MDRVYFFGTQQRAMMVTTREELDNMDDNLNGIENPVNFEIAYFPSDLPYLLNVWVDGGKDNNGILKHGFV